PYNALKAVNLAKHNQSVIQLNIDAVYRRLDQAKRSQDVAQGPTMFGSDTRVHGNHPLVRSAAARDHIVEPGEQKRGRVRKSKNSLRKRLAKLRNAGMLDLTKGMLQGRSVSEFISATLTVGRVPTDARAGESLDRSLQANSLREFVVSTLPQGQPMRAVRSETMPSAQTSSKRSSLSPSTRIVRVIESPPPQTETILDSPIRIVREDTP
ncbi:MAG: hypothetical protein ACK56I_06235, partial [bacterium]